MVSCSICCSPFADLTRHTVNVQTVESDSSNCDECQTRNVSVGARRSDHLAIVTLGVRSCLCIIALAGTTSARECGRVLAAAIRATLFCVLLIGCLNTTGVAFIGREAVLSEAADNTG